MPIKSNGSKLRKIAGWTTLFITSTALHGAPVIPGVDRLTDNSDTLAGEILLGELACTQCHAAGDKTTTIWSKSAPNLSLVGARVTPQYLERFLKSTHSAKPGTTMPDIFHSSESSARDGAVDYLTHFLTSLGGPIAPSTSGGSQKMVDHGKKLFHTVGCVACHGPQEEQGSDDFKPLGNLAEKTTVDALTEFLLDPHQARPSGRMPSLWLSRDDARAISVYLLRQQLENEQSKDAPPANQPGLYVDYYEIDGINKLPDFSQHTPITKSKTDSITLDLAFKTRKNNYALRFHGQIIIEETNQYRFGTRSDDGSQIRINGELVVDNDGTHGPRPRAGDIKLEAGTHDFELTFFNAGAGDELQVFWRKGVHEEGSRRGYGAIPSNVFMRSGGLPMVPLNSREFTVDAEKVAVGQRMFQALRCASCHTANDVQPLSTSKPLAQLNVDSPDGCLSSNIRRGLPDYQLSSNQLSQIKAALRNLAAQAAPRTAAEQVTKTLATFNCYACHERGGIGGPNDDLAANYFESVGDIDLGEEGKIPPTLNYAGAKLKSSAIESILSSQDLHVRHYMKTRMPNFGSENLHAFIENIAAADDSPGDDPEPEFSEEAAELGRKFVGTSGLACITCHQIDGQKALAIQGIDLSSVYDRVKPTWFESFMLEPAKYNKDTRMPQFFINGESPFTDILEGDPSKQIQTILTYLSLKKSLTLPVGITPEGSVAMELIPAETPIVHRTFMEDVGPRAILTGFPEKLSTAFDANVVRMAKIWRGRFFDHSGVESGRTDRFLTPLGDDVLNLPAGPAFASLASPLDPWPAVEKTSRNVGGRFIGYTLNSERNPTFRYQLGDTLVQERAEPVLRPGGTIVERHFDIERSSKDPLYFLAAEGQTIEDQGDLTYRVDGTVIHLSGSPTPRPILRTLEAGRQILIPINGPNASLTQTIEW